MLQGANILSTLLRGNMKRACACALECVFFYYCMSSLSELACSRLRACCLHSGPSIFSNESAAALQYTAHKHAHTLLYTLYSTCTYCTPVLVYEGRKQDNVLLSHKKTATDINCTPAQVDVSVKGTHHLNTYNLCWMYCIWPLLVTLNNNAQESG